MTGRNAFLRVAFAALIALPTGAQAGPVSPDQVEQIRTFATCAGRMMAVRDHLALFGGPEVNRAEAAREAHVAVLDALLETALTDGLDGRRVTAWRVDARAAQAAVLTQADFGTTLEARQRARAASARHVAACDRLILGV
jgi:hypothetical protein